ncbi:MAG: TnpV protein [Anaerolineaceae bacterium]|nr:TnpV protein [Anaerolineaceae bacterium]
MKTIFEEMGGSYIEVNETMIPDLVIQESEPIGKYGRMRRRYLKKEHPIIFSELLLSEQLYPHLVEIDRACHGRLELLTRQMKVQEDVTEALKATDQMEWVRRMNSIQNRAEEIVLNELVYLEEASDADT